MFDEEGFCLEKSKIAIIGLGLMGGSLALALKGKCADLMAVIPRASTREMALRLKVVSKADEDPAKILPKADVIILSTPVPAILDWLAHLAEYAPQRCIVMDLGSSKQIIVQAMNQLPERFIAIGGHPICGKENLSLENADPDLYQNAAFILTPPERISARANDAVLQIIRAIGARPVWLDAYTHDRLLAFTSHLPFLLASALTLSAPEDAGALVGPGFISTSRLASTPASMMLGILQTNQENVLRAIEVFKGQLDLLAEVIKAQDIDKLNEILNSARSKRQKFL
jgi:prephenate dehydrogenase